MATSCPHFEALPFARLVGNPSANDDPLVIKLKNKIESEKGCMICGRNVKSFYICLNPDCFFVGCGRNDKRHAMEHYQMRHKPGEERLHCFFLDANAYQCWCYECDDLIIPPVLAAMEPIDDAQTISSVNTSVSSKKKAVMATGPSSILPISGVVGLYNLGNSCYMNAAIQAFFNCSSIWGYFQNCHAFIYRNNHHNHRIAESFHKLVDAILTSNLTVISPSRLVREVKMINPMFHGYTQQDTMDFVRCIFERLHEELACSSPTRQPPQQLQQPSSDEIDLSSSPTSRQRRRSERLAKQGPRKDSFPSLKWRDSPKHKSIISDTFGGMLRSEIQCEECQNVSIKDDPFYDVSVQICSSSSDNGKGGKPSSLGYIGNLFSSIGESMGINGKPVKLEACLAAFCAPEILEGKDRYRCEKCNKLVKSKKSLKFKELPQVLVIQLKRFRHESYFSSKIGTHVISPLDNLDLTPYLHEAASEVTRHETRYYLSVIISHRGTFSGGHYVAYCRNVSTGQWLEFDDSNVTVVSEEEVAKVQAYVLFYSLVDWNSRKEREEWLSTIEGASLVNKEEESVYISKEWINRWKTMVHPGPIDNHELLCAHGRVSPENMIDPLQLVQSIPEKTFQYFAHRHGEISGCPALRNVSVCECCIGEAKRLDERRKVEDRDIQALDTSTIKPGEAWYLISSEWLIGWGRFKTGLGELPGPICNDRLVMPDGQPRPSLIRGTHYRGINKRVWDYFVKVYSGGPLIVRKNINIYSPSVHLPADVDKNSNISDDVYVDVVGH